MSSILVIGCLSFDTIHLEGSTEKNTFATVGGAGLYTALAAAHSGSDVTLYAPRPETIPDLCSEIENRLNWIGPSVSLDRMPTLEIVQHGENRATLLNAQWGAEDLLSPQDLALRVDTSFDIAHIAALSSAGKQLGFLDWLQKEEVAERVSAGTYTRAITNDSDSVRQLLEDADLFFMNKNESNLLFESRPIRVSADHLIFITDGSEGATVYSHEKSETVKAVAVPSLDPTGAGDTFCGAVLAKLAENDNLSHALTLGAELAAQIIQHPGTSYYFGAENRLV